MNITIKLNEAEIHALKEFRMRHEFFEALPTQSLRSVIQGVDSLLLKASKVVLSQAEVDEIRAKARSKAERIIIGT